MSTTTSATTLSTRIASIDVFRGLTILAMIFVNDVAGVKNIPAWMKHVAPGVDGMTFVDVVFPAFLFIVGMSIPFAIDAREQKGHSTLQTWKHILIRTLGLLVLGVFMVNAERGNFSPEGMLVDIRLWSIVLYIFAMMIWNRYPRTESKQSLYKGLQVAGLIGLIALFFLYRGGDGTQMMRPHWWGILGLIGWAYLYACIVYLGFQKSMAAVIGMIAVFIAMYMGLRAENLHLPAALGWLKSQGGHASHTAITLSGVVLSGFIFKKNPKTDFTSIFRNMLAFAAMLAVAGFFLRPIYGIGKIGATPSWSLYSAAICVVVFGLLYGLMDVKGISRWSKFLQPAGANPLLIYFLPFIFYPLISLLGITFLSEYLGTGIIGILRSIAFALLMLWAVAGLNKLGIKLKL